MEIETWSTRSHCVENSLGDSLWTRSKTEFVMNEFPHSLFSNKSISLLLYFSVFPYQTHNSLLGQILPIIFRILAETFSLYVSHLSFTVSSVYLHFVPTNYSIPMQAYSHISVQFSDTSEREMRAVSRSRVLRQTSSLRFTGREPVTGAVWLSDWCRESRFTETLAGEAGSYIIRHVSCRHRLSKTATQ